MPNSNAIDGSMPYTVTGASVSAGSWIPPDSGHYRMGEQVSRPGSYLVFDVGGQPFATDVCHVREVLALPRITPIPARLKGFEGMIDLRGTSVPVLNLATLLMMEAGGRSEATRVVVCEITDGSALRLVALIVDRVDQVLPLSEREIEPPPTTGIIDSPFVTGLARLGNEALTVILDVQSMLSTLALAESGR